MRFVLFCLNNYAFAILNPIKEILIEENHDFIWYLGPKVKDDFPYKSEPHTSSIKNIKAYKSDVIFAPGNEVPFFKGSKNTNFSWFRWRKKRPF